MQQVLHSSMSGRWLLLAYRAPQQPSTARAAAWRLLKGSGALYLQQSVCLLPDRPSARETIGRVRAFIEEAGGETTLLEIARISPASETVLRARFNALRESEYRELLDRCAAFHEELRREAARGHFSFAEVEENEDDLVKLRAWLRKIRTRDVFGCPLASDADAAVGRCAAELDTFTRRVLAREGVGQAGRKRTRSRS